MGVYGNEGGIMNTIPEMLDYMTDMFESMLEMDMSTLAKFKCIKTLRDALVVEGFGETDANLLACKAELDVADSIFGDYEEEITEQIKLFAKVIKKLYVVVECEFDMDVTMFVDTFASQLKYTVTE